MPNEPRDMMDAVSRSMAERTGRSLEEWMELVDAAAADTAADTAADNAADAAADAAADMPTSEAAAAASASASALDPLDQKAVRAWLKAEHGLAQNTQWAIADAVARAHGWNPPTVDQYVDAMYTGKKAPLRPLHDAVVEAGAALEGVEVQGRSTYTPLVRHSQFAAVGPGTFGRLRIGFRFRGTVPDDPRLEPAKGFAQATHVIQVAPVADDGAAVVPADLARSVAELLRCAWEQN